MSGAGVDSSGCDGEEAEEESYSVEDRLERFRSDWKQELAAKEKGDDEEEKEKTAKELFMKGVDSEQQGSVCEAVAYYRQAIRLVPDIEFRIEELRHINDSDPWERKRTESSSSVDSSCANELFDCEDLVAHFSKMKVSEKAICERESEQRSIHISVLPAEVFQHILRWVVSSSLDLRSLEMFSMVCRGFYLLSRDLTLWKMACAQVWRRKELKLSAQFSSWRDMYLNKQRLNFDGVYISRASYFRTFENEYGCISHNSWHFFVFFRYARFFPSGHVIMLTTPQEPVNIVSKLRYKSMTMEGLQYGHYTVKGDEVHVTVKYNRRQEPKSSYKHKRKQYDFDSGENTFHATFTLKSNVQNGTSRLDWANYHMVTKYRKSPPSVTQFDIHDSRHPPLRFSRVLSFTAVSEEILDFPSKVTN